MIPVFALFVRVLSALPLFFLFDSFAHADDWEGVHVSWGSLFWMLVGALVTGVVSVVSSYVSSRRRNFEPNFVHRQIKAGPVSHPKMNGEVARREEEENDDSSDYLTSLDETTTVIVEELSNIIEQADLFLLLGRPEMAISMLLSCIMKEGENDPRVWFKLLDIYHGQGDRHNFALLANKIHQHFNVAQPSWEFRTLEAAGRHGLDHFPHLLARITATWGTPEGLKYLNSLVNDDRGEKRSGFSEDAFREVMFLISLLEQEEG